MWLCRRAAVPRDDRTVRQSVDLIQLNSVSATPLAQGQKHRLKAEAERRCAVFDARGHLAKDLAMHDPVLFHLAQFASGLADIHVMLQREVVARMAAKPGTPDYGRLTVMLLSLIHI